MVMKIVTGTEAAPSVVTMTGAMPVTRMVPARPMTKAPHQLVSFARPPPAYSRASEDTAGAPDCSGMNYSSSSDRDTKCGTTHVAPRSQARTCAHNLAAPNCVRDAHRSDGKRGRPAHFGWTAEGDISGAQPLRLPPAR